MNALADREKVQSISGSPLLPFLPLLTGQVPYHGIDHYNRYSVLFPQRCPNNLSNRFRRKPVSVLRRLVQDPLLETAREFRVVLFRFIKTFHTINCIAAICFYRETARRFRFFRIYTGIANCELHSWPF